MYNFNETNIIDSLEELVDDELDHLGFGVIGFDKNTFIRRYNYKEEELSGYKREHLLGKPFFSEVAPCMDNYRVALRFLQEAELDVTIPYLLALKIKPVRVQLRLLKQSTCPLRFILVQK